MQITRRRAMVGAGALAGVAAAGLGLRAQTGASFTRALPLPPLVDLTDGRDAFDLVVGEGRSRIVAAGETATYGYSATMLGPIVRVRSGQSVTARITNTLPRETSVHWHGLFVPSSVDGPYNPIAPGAAFAPTLHVRQPATTAWFHPHPHGDTARQTYMGLAGLFYVEDGSAAEFNLPRDHGLDDLPIVIQDRTFGPDGQLVYDRSPIALMHGSRGEQVMVNGALRPVARPPAGLVRLRLLDGANARNFKLGFSDERVFHVIANDAGWLAEPVPLKEIELSPGERYEIIVDFTDGKPADLVTWPDHNGRFGDGVSERAKEIFARLRERRQAVMRFEPQAIPGRPARSLPKRLTSPGPVEPARSVRRRTLVLDSMMMANMSAMRGGGGMSGMDHSRMGQGGGMQAGPMAGMTSAMRMGINGLTYDMNRIDAEVALGSQEIWEIRSVEMAHPFHVHGASFRTLSKDGKPVPAHEAGVKDTVLVEQTAELLVTFLQPTSSKQPFVYHCHILEHEELGMMGTYLARPEV